MQDNDTPAEDSSSSRPDFPGRMILSAFESGIAELHQIVDELWNFLPISEQKNTPRFSGANAEGKERVQPLLSLDIRVRLAYSAQRRHQSDMSALFNSLKTALTHEDEARTILTAVSESLNEHGGFDDDAYESLSSHSDDF